MDTAAKRKEQARKEQNRRAQRAFRARKKRIVEEKEQVIIEKEQLITHLRAQLHNWEAENTVLKYRSNCDGSSTLPKSRNGASMESSRSPIPHSCLQAPGDAEHTLMLPDTSENNHAIHTPSTLPTTFADQDIQDLFGEHYDGQELYQERPMEFTEAFPAPQPEQDSLENFQICGTKWSQDDLLARSIEEFGKSETYAVQAAEWWKQASDRANQKALMFAWFQRQNAFLPVVSGSTSSLAGITQPIDNFLLGQDGTPAQTCGPLMLPESRS